MVKLSKGYLIVWCRFFPIGLFIVHFWFIIFCFFLLRFWPFTIAYLVMATATVLKKPWRLLLLRDVYLISSTKNIVFVNLANNKFEFNTTEIVKTKTRRDLKSIETFRDGKTEIFYCIISPKENLKFLTPSFT